MWTPLSTPPCQSGRYIVAHRGAAKIIHYLHPDGDWCSGIKVGWQDDPRSFGANHYQHLEEVTLEDGVAAEERRLELIADRDVVEGQINDLEARLAEIDDILATVRNGNSKKSYLADKTA